MKPAMTITAALAMLTGPRSISNPDLECLGEGDLLALQTLIAAYKATQAPKAVTLTKDEAKECLLLLDDLAAYALDGWFENGDMDADSQAIWSERLDTIRHKVGGKGSWNDDSNRNLRG